MKEKRILSIFWHFGVCALSCGPWCRGSVHLKEFRTEMYERPVLFLLCGVWMYPSLSPVRRLLSLSTDLCWLLIYNFGPSVLSHVYTVHMWKLFQWLSWETVSASISPNQYASNNTTEMSGRKLAPGKISKDWTKSKTSSGLTIPKWYLWSCRMLGCSPVYYCYILNSRQTSTTQGDRSQNEAVTLNILRNK